MKPRPTLENTPMPADLDAENTLLATCLYDRADALDIADRCRPEYFTTGRTLRIFETIRRLLDIGAPIDAGLLSAECRKACKSDDLDDGLYISRLMDLTPISGNIGHHVNLLSEAYRRRQIIRAANDAMTGALTPGRDPEKILAKLQADAFDLDADGSGADPVRPFSELIEKVGDQMEAIQKRGVKPGIQTGLYDLDRVLIGLQPAELIILAARPGMGKTALANRIKLNAAADGHPVGFMSMEMSKESLTLRDICAESGIPYDRAFGGFMDPEEWTRFVDKQAKIHEYKIFIDDSPALHYQEIARRLRKMKRVNGIELAIIDYLQLARGEKTDGRVVEVGSIAEGLKAIAKELNIPVLSLSQLSRACENRPNRRPQLSDLRESGAIEQAADVVIGLYNAGYYGAEQKDITEAIILKQRNGKTGTVKLGWNGPAMQFYNAIKQRGEK